MIRNFFLSVVASMLAITAVAQKNYSVVSPDGELKAEVSVADGKITYAVAKGEVQLISPSEIAMFLEDGTAYNGAVKLQKSKKET
jgi:hypothetical protein